METTEEAREFLGAGLQLIEKSGLARLRGGRLDAENDLESFERWHEKEYPGGFGRLISWMLFSVGAEYIAKAACLSWGNIVTVKKNRRSDVGYPPRHGSAQEWEQWECEAAEGRRSGPRVLVYDYGALSAYYDKDKGDYLGHLADRAELCECERRRVLAGYRLLGAIRNRDLHAYVRAIRWGDFYLVPRLFVPCLNILLKGFRDQDLAHAVVKSHQPAHGH